VTVATWWFVAVCPHGLGVGMVDFDWQIKIYI